MPLFPFLAVLIFCHGSPVHWAVCLSLLQEFLGFPLKNLLQIFKTSLKNNSVLVFFLRRQQ